MQVLVNLRAQAYNPCMSSHQSNTTTLWQALLPRPDASSHKYSRGHVLIQGGYPVTGAARLAAMAAARSGAGLTAIAVPEQALPIYASQLLSIMAKPYADRSQLNALIHDTRVNAYLIGPGAGLTEETLQTTLTMLQTGKPVVMDADALSVLAAHPQACNPRAMAHCVLTPHAGEFSRLFGITPSTESTRRIQQTQAAAASIGAVVLLKGAQTMIANPEGRIIINEHAPATLATAGAGDVLAGMIVSLLAQGMPAMEACAAATWLHGEAARRFGMGLIAEDIPGLIPGVWQTLAT